MKHRLPKALVVGYALFVASSIALPATAGATDTPTEAIAACIENAWNVNSDCQTDDSWMNDLPCAVKFEADVILCTGAIF